MRSVSLAASTTSGVSALSWLSVCILRTCVSSLSTSRKFPPVILAIVATAVEYPRLSSGLWGPRGQALGEHGCQLFSGEWLEFVGEAYAAV